MSDSNPIMTTIILALVMVATTFLAVVLVESGNLENAPRVLIESVEDTSSTPRQSSTSTSNTTSSSTTSRSEEQTSTSTQTEVAGVIYDVRDGDDLQSVAEEFYGDPDLFPAIVWASTMQAANDPDFAINTENNQIEAGRPLLIPEAADIDAWQRRFMQADRLHNDVLEATVQELQDAMASGEMTSQMLVRAYMDRIEALDDAGPYLNAVIEVNPDALEIARQLDEERAASGPRGPLHGIPVLLKDNIDTADEMQTTAGSVTLLGSKPSRDAYVVQRLREAGAVILGKANLSEWANFRGSPSISGWSGRGGLTRNPYRLDHTPWGSSSGSGAAVAANLVSVALGTETAGSISAPASINGVVGLKPSVGLTSRAGVVPIAHSFDTVGPLTRTVSDAAIVLTAIAGVDPRDPATTSAEGHVADYTEFLNADGLNGARIGVPMNLLNLQGDAEKEMLFEQTLEIMRARGAEIVEVEMPLLQELIDWFGSPNNFGNVLRYEFKSDIAQYLATRIPSSPGNFVPRSLADLVDLNNEYDELELSWFGQELFEESLSRGGIDEVGYLEGLYEGRRLSGRDGIDALLAEHNLDTLVLPALESFARIYAALPGYPLLTVPASFTQDGLPFSIGFFGSAFSEPTLITMAYAFEQATQARRPPQYLLRVDDAYNRAVLSPTGTTFASTRAYVHWLADDDDMCAALLEQNLSCTLTLTFGPDGMAQFRIDDAIYLGQYEVGNGILSIQFDISPGGIPPIWLFSMSSDSLTLKDLDGDTIWVLSS
jgi:amidase